jgi:class 3 adenylate cyclase/tetratricopeptide (TPR) repeat protein/type II secretory pathway predicted ATPase ExeA
MLALYRCGRQAEALDAYQHARRIMVDELGVEPSKALSELERAILRQDAELDVAPAIMPAAPSRAAQMEPVPAGVTDPEASSEEDATAEEVVRKIATVVVVRLGASSGADPEMSRALISTARGRADQILASHGGTFVSGIGGALVGVFGLPLTREDDALRALRAAAELRSGLAAADDRGRTRLEVRVGVDSGEVVAEALGDVFGEPLDGAAAYASAARDAEVLLSDATRQLATSVVDVEPAEAGWRLVGMKVFADAPAAVAEGPMVGREQELEAAYGMFERSCQSSKPHLLTVIGDAGIGKSRLSRALVERIGPDATVLTGRCLPYGDGTTFWPLREAITGSVESESPDAIARLVDAANDSQLVTAIVAAALRLAPGDGTGEQVPWAFRRLFEAIANRCPVVLVIEDAHWAEPPLLELIEDLLDWVSGPMLMLFLGRPELLEARPAWGGGHQRVSSVILEPLDDASALELVKQQPAGWPLSGGEASAILRASEGNPLFVEQLIAMSADNPDWDLALNIPPTIQTLLAARLDRLDPGERAFIQRAALIGREFWTDAVVELLPEKARANAGRQLRALVRRGLIQPAKSTLMGEEQVRFHHILIRDVAYRSTPKVLRYELHERFAEWLAAKHAGYEDFVGHHLDLAFRYRTELGHTDENTRPLALRAADRLSTAGRAALSRGDTTACIKHLRRSAELFEVGGQRRPDVLLDLGSALSESGDFASAEPVLQTALAGAREIGAEALGARAMIELSYWHSRGDRDIRAHEMLATAERAIAIFSDEGDESGLSRAWQHIAWAHWITSRCGEMEPALECALRYAERAGERRDRSRMLSDLARATVIGPRPVGQGIRRCNEIVERARGDIAPVAFTEAMLAVLDAMDGRPDDARDRWRQSKDRLAEVGLILGVAVVQMYYAFIELLAEQPDEAIPEVTDACATFERIGERGRLSTAAALLARLLCELGLDEESARYAEISQDAASPDDVVSQVLWRGVRARLLARAGARQAEELAGTGVEMVRHTDFLMLHGDALCARADVLARLGRPGQAVADLEEAAVLFERKGIRPAVGGVRRALHTLVPDAATPPR